jgi:hypothetical protein
MLPPPFVWIALDAVRALAAVAGRFVVWLRIDQWRSLEPLGLPAWVPRSWIAPRSWARPRNLLALQPTDNHPRMINRLLRTALRERR